MCAINIILAIVALILLLGVVGEKDKQKNTNLTVAFVAGAVLIMVLNR